MIGTMIRNGIVGFTLALMLPFAAGAQMSPQLERLEHVRTPDGQTKLVLKTSKTDPKPVVEWIAGGLAFMPPEILKLYPCHSVEEPCFNIPAPAVEKVTFKGPINGDAKRGEAIAINIRWGNCIACHSLPNGHKGGTIGIDLSAYASLNHPLDYIYQRIWDNRVFAPDAHMPVYGANKVLLDQDIRDVMAFLLPGK
jgi:sulfur-oxidizing protein SoxX